MCIFAYICKYRISEQFFMHFYTWQIKNGDKFTDALPEAFLTNIVAAFVNT